jgi:hypothetical protein
MASKLKRVSAPTENAIVDLANREGRTFIAQLDRVVDAGLRALGEQPINRDEVTATAS